MIKKVPTEFKRPLFVLKSGETGFNHQSDIENSDNPQEPNFYYLTGVKEFSCHLTIDLANKETILFCEKMPSELSMWMNLITK